MNRKIIISLSGVLLLVLAYWGSNLMKSNKKERPVSNEEIIKSVFIQTYEPGKVPVSIRESGNLVPKHKVDLYSEVQGVLNTNKKEFRTGVSYKKGEVILSINSDEFYASLLAQKSALQNLIASVMPDLRLDYPDSYEAWFAYLGEFDIQKKLKPLPEPKSDKERYFITGRNIYSNFYTVKNLEARLDKFILRAPYNGVLTETNVTTGTLVRSGQLVGEFIDPSVYELAVSVNASIAQRLVLKQTVELEDIEGNLKVKGTLSRINSKIDINTQTVLCFIEVRNSDLRAGMFLNAIIPGQTFDNAFLVSRKLLVENNALYAVENDVLTLKPVKTLFYNDDSVIVSGLQKGDKLLSRPVPGAFPGMRVSVVEAN